MVTKHMMHLWKGVHKPNAEIVRGDMGKASARFGVRCAHRAIETMRTTSQRYWASCSGEPKTRSRSA